MADNNQIDRNPMRNPDKAYYGSGNPSALGNANRYAANRVGRVGTPMQVQKDPVADPKETDTRKYYANEGVGRNRVGNRRGTVEVSVEPVALIGGRRVIVPNAPTARDLPDGWQQVAANHADDAIEISRMTIELLQNPSVLGVIVQVSDAGVERLIRSQISLAVARTQLTHDRGRDVRYSQGNAQAQRQFIDALTAPPDSTEDTDTDDEMGLDLGDPFAFVGRQPPVDSVVTGDDVVTDDAQPVDNELAELAADVAVGNPVVRETLDAKTQTEILQNGWADDHRREAAADTD